MNINHIAKRFSFACVLGIAMIFSLSGCGGSGTSDGTQHALPDGTSFVIGVGPMADKYTYNGVVYETPTPFNKEIHFTAGAGLAGQVVVDGEVTGCVYSISGNPDGTFDFSIGWGRINLVNEQITLTGVSLNTAGIFGQVKGWSIASGGIVYEGTQGKLIK